MSSLAHLEWQCRLSMSMRYYFHFEALYPSYLLVDIGWSEWKQFDWMDMVFVRLSFIPQRCCCTRGSWNAGNVLNGFCQNFHGDYECCMNWLWWKPINSTLLVRIPKSSRNSLLNASCLHYCTSISICTDVTSNWIQLILCSLFSWKRFWVSAMCFRTKRCDK